MRIAILLAMASLALVLSPPAFAGEVTDDGRNAALAAAQQAWDAGDADGVVSALLPLASTGDAEAQDWLGRLYTLWGDYDEEALAENLPVAFSWFQDAADQDYVKGQHHLAFMYENGFGVQQDAAMAAVWFRKAAEQGYVLSQARLGWMYANGSGVAEDDAEAITWLTKAADQHSAIAEHKLGVMYLVGRGVPRDHVAAWRWFDRMAADIHGPEEAMQVDSGLGTPYVTEMTELGDFAANLMTAQERTEAGLPTVEAPPEADEVMAVVAKAEQGDSGAQYELGFLFSGPYHGVPMDSALSQAWYRMAADQGHAGAQDRLGFAYFRGIDMPKDFVQACKWYHLSAAGAKTQADRDEELQRCDVLAGQMTAEQIAAAAAMAAAWKPVLQAR